MSFQGISMSAPDPHATGNATESSPGKVLVVDDDPSFRRLLEFIVTGQGEVDVAVELMRMGADDYLVKPFEPAVVLASIERGLKKKQLEIELQTYRSRLEQMVSERTGQLQAALARIEQNYDETLEALGSAIDLRDNETAGHSRRVCLYSLEIAKVCGCSSADFVTLGRGAWL